MDKLLKTNVETPSNGASLAYSCVVDRNEAIERAVLIWAHSLVGLENVDPKHLYVHTVDQDLEVLSLLKSLGVQIIPIQRFGDGKHCNKLAQPVSSTEFDADILLMSDCDIAFTGGFSDAIIRATGSAMNETKRIVLGKTVDFCNPPLSIIECLMEHFGIGLPKALKYDTLHAAPMPQGYFNGGMYGIPVPLLSELGDSWRAWAMRLLESEEALAMLGRYAWHIDQISFYFATHELDFQPINLDERFNFPIHVNHSTFRQPAVAKPFAIHFHNNLDSSGLIGSSGIRAVDRAVESINDQLNKRGLKCEQGYISSKPFTSWHTVEKDFSMTTRNAAALRSFLRAAGIERAGTIVDVRCASGRHLEGLSLKKYKGFDSRSEMIEIARCRDTDATFMTGLPTSEDRAELTICLDFMGFAQDVGNPRLAASQLAEMTDERLLVLGEPDSGLSWLSTINGGADVAGLLAQTGEFFDILDLGNFAGRRAFLAFATSSEEHAGPARLAMSGVDRLYTYLASEESKISASAEIKILKRLPARLEGQRIAVLTKGELSGAFDIILKLRGVEPTTPQVTFLQNTDDKMIDGERVMKDELAKDEPFPLEDKYEFICILPDNENQNSYSQIAGWLSSRSRLGATVFLAVRTEKRADATKVSDSGEVIFIGAIENTLMENDLLPTARHTISLPFDISNDVCVIEAVRLAPRENLPIIAVRKRTPEFLRRIERTVRRTIRRQNKLDTG